MLTLTSLILDSDIFMNLMPCLGVDAIIELSCCSRLINDFLCSEKCLQILSLVYLLPKSFTNLRKWLREYYHRSLDCDYSHYFQLKRRAKDRHEICKAILCCGCVLNEDILSQFYFESGRRGDWETFELVNKKLPRISVFYGGLVFGLQISAIPDSFVVTIDNLVVLLFEAFRSNNYGVRQQLCCSELARANPMIETTARLYGAVASNDCLELREILEAQIGKMFFTVPLYDDLLRAKDLDLSSKLIIYAMHFQSFDAADLIYKMLYVDYENILSSDYSIPNVTVYQWIGEKYTLPDKYQEMILYDALTIQKLDLVNFLQNRLNPEKPPRCFGEMVNLNNYKTVSWLFETFKYTRESLEAAFNPDGECEDIYSRNYSCWLLRDYISTLPR